MTLRAVYPGSTGSQMVWTGDGFEEQPIAGKGPVRWVDAATGAAPTSWEDIQHAKILSGQVNPANFGQPGFDPGVAQFLQQQQQRVAQQRAGSDWDSRAVNTAIPIAAGALAGGGLYGAMAGEGGALASGASASESGTLAGGSSNTTLAGGTTGETGMWDWLDTLDDGGSFDPGGDLYSGNPTPSGGETGAFDMNGSQGVFDSNGNPLYSSPGFSLKDILSGGKDAFGMLKGLIGSGGGAGGSAGGGMLGGILNDPLGSAFNATPFLLALNEANRQSGDINGVLGNINSDAYRKSVLDPYDMQTAAQRGSLQNDLALRGVAGSSFGNNDINNFDYSHGLARSDMATKANMATAGLQGQLINQRNTNRNLLLGAGLNASGKLFAPQQDPFNLRALLGA